MVSLIDLATFRAVAQQRGVRPRQYDSYIGMTLLDRISETEEAGDRILLLAREGRLSRERADTLLDRLLACYAEPLVQGDDVVTIQLELRRYDK